MARFQVAQVITGNKINVQNAWTWGSYSGNIVCINGYSLDNIPEDHLIYFYNRLKALLNGKYITLKYPTHISPDEKTDSSILHCSVFLNEIDVKEYFFDAWPSEVEKVRPNLFRSAFSRVAH